MSATRTKGASRRRSPEPAAATEVEVDEVSPTAGAKRTVMHYVRELPKYLRLLGGLLGDRRVSIVDKLLVVGAIAYIASPLDLVPDFIPFFGQVDDLYLLVLALQRLITNAGRSVLIAHWAGDVTDISTTSLRQALAAAAFFLPRRLRRRLQRRLF